jgi:hypothetical protein
MQRQIFMFIWNSHLMWASQTVSSLQPPSTYLLQKRFEIDGSVLFLLSHDLMSPVIVLNFFLSTETILGSTTHKHEHSMCNLFYVCCHPLLRSFICAHYVFCLCF